MATADVTVMGGGIFGLACAHACARRGARVRLIEARAIGAGASGGVVGALAPHVPENWNPKKAFQLDSLLMAEAYWADVAEVSGIDPGYARTGRLQPLADARGGGRWRRRGPCKRGRCGRAGPTGRWWPGGVARLGPRHRPLAWSSTTR